MTATLFGKDNELKKFRLNNMLAASLQAFDKAYCLSESLNITLPSFPFILNIQLRLAFVALVRLADDVGRGGGC